MEFRPILSSLARNKTGPLLVAAQIALSLAILANALHIVGVRQAAAARPSGAAHEDDLFYLRVRPIQDRNFNEEMAAQKQEEAALRAVPGLLAAAGVSQLPLSRSGWITNVYADRKQIKPAAMPSPYFASGSLVQAWGLKLLEGRDFRPEEIREIDDNVSEEFPSTVMVTQAVAGKLFPGTASVVGKSLLFGGGRKELRITGVVERLQTPSAQLGEQGELSVILPIRNSDVGATYTIRAAPGQRERVMRDAQAALRGSVTSPLLIRATTMEQDRIDRYRDDKALSWMLIAVSVLLLTVTASGIVGMASLWVTQRRKQIGVRRALGARRIDILRYFLTENMLISSAGVAAGALLGLALNALLVSELELSRLPAAYLMGGAVLFWALGAIAVYGPAWRAAGISPATATRGA